MKDVNKQARIFCRIFRSTDGGRSNCDAVRTCTRNCISRGMKNEPHTCTGDNFLKMRVARRNDDATFSASSVYLKTSVRRQCFAAKWMNTSNRNKRAVGEGNRATMKNSVGAAFLSSLIAPTVNTPLSWFGDEDPTAKYEVRNYRWRNSLKCITVFILQYLRFRAPAPLIYSIYFLLRVCPAAGSVFARERLTTEK